MNVKSQEFFVVALPGLEDLVQAEITEWFPDFETRLEHGGVTVHAPLAQGLAMNLALKTATRILLRITSFRCRDFPKLYQKIEGLDWSEWIDPRCDLRVVASTRLSRLKIKKRIEETCVDGWRAYQKKTAVKPAGRKLTADLYVRFLNDECTLSLDTSGERLHKRGQRQHIGEAPLRETIAASLVQLVQRTSPAMTPVELVDPMMGSGTFLLEGLIRDELVDQRDFSFAMFRQSPKDKPKLRVPRTPVEGLIGFEQDEKSVTAARFNFRQTKMQPQVFTEDFFKATALPSSRLRRWLFCNPPYNERLKVEEPLQALYERLFAAVHTKVGPERACFLLPAKAVKGKFKLPEGWRVLEKRPFLNGGIPVVAFVFATQPE